MRVSLRRRLGVGDVNITNTPNLRDTQVDLFVATTALLDAAETVKEIRAKLLELAPAIPDEAPSGSRDHSEVADG